MRSLCVRSLDQYDPQEVVWLWPGRFPRGKVTLLAGDPGLGKSFITMDLAARVSRGLGWPDAPGNGKAGGVLVLSAEDDPADTLRPRLERCGGDPSRVVFVGGVKHAEDGPELGVDLQVDIPALEDAVRVHGSRLVIIDPISAYMGQTDSNNNAEVRGLLKELSRLAMEYGPAVVCVTHLNKSSQGSKAVYRAMGSLAFTAAARVVWQVSRVPGEDDLRAMTLVKSNLAANPKGMTYRIADGRVEWVSSDFELHADEVEAGVGEGPPDSLREAAEFLKSALAGGPRPAAEVISEAEQAGLSVEGLKRAKRLAGVRAMRAESGGPRRPWVWAIGGAS